MVLFAMAYLKIIKKHASLLQSNGGAGELLH